MRSHFVALILLASSSALAETSALPPNWRSMTPQQLNALSKEQIAQLPLLEYLDRTDQSLSRAKMEPMVATVLSRLFYAMDRPVYPFGPFIEAATRELQTEIGASVDGVLKFSEFEQAMSRVQGLDKASYPIFPRSKTDVYVSPSGDFVAFGGTWVIEGDQHAFPVNYTDYQCFKSNMTCYLAEGNLMASPGTATMSVEGSFQKIIKWDSSEILMEDNAKCRVSTTSVNLKNKEVLQITRNKDSGCDLKWLPPLTTPRISRLVDGLKVNEELNQKQAEVNQQSFSKRFQAVAKALKSN